MVSTSGDRQVLYVAEAAVENSGIISCVAENDVGKATCAAKLRVNLGKWGFALNILLVTENRID